MKHSKKKKRSRPKNQTRVKGGECNEESKQVRGLMEVFTSVSLEEAQSAYRETNGDPNRAAEILGGLTESADDDQDTSGSAGPSLSSGGSCSSSSATEVFTESNLRGFRGANKQKKVVAATGTVSTVLGKEYVMSSPKKDSFKRKGYVNEPASKEVAEQFLCSMLGDNSELSLAVVKDVLCQCGYGVEKALNALLELSASSRERSKNGQSYEHTVNNEGNSRLLLECRDNLSDRTSDSTSHTSENEIQDNIWSMGYRDRNYSEVLTGSEVHSMTGISKSELPQKVLESLFNMPESSEHEPINMNWRNIVKRMESLGQRFECDPADTVESEHIHAKGDEYQVLRKASWQHWDSMQSYYHKAASAFSNGKREYASYLSDQGRLCNKMAQEADKKASQEIFKARNKSIENVITIDLHGQHVKQAMKLLKIHLLFGAYVCSVQILRVITGCGSHGVGKSKLKQSVIDLVKREGIEWSEENRGTILIKLDGQRAFSFSESESDGE